MKTKSIVGTFLTLMLLTTIFMTPVADARSGSGSSSSRSSGSSRSSSPSRSSSSSSSSSSRSSSPSRSTSTYSAPSKSSTTTRSTGSSSGSSHSAPPVVIINNGNGGNGGYRDDYYSAPSSSGGYSAGDDVNWEDVDFSGFWSFIATIMLIVGGLLGLTVVLAVGGAILKAVAEAIENMPSEMEDDKQTLLTVQVAFLSESAEAYTLRDEIRELIENGDGIDSDIAHAKKIALLLSRNQSGLSHVYATTASINKATSDEKLNEVLAKERAKYTSDRFTGEITPVYIDQTDVEAAIPGYVFVVTLVLCLEHNRIEIKPEVTDVNGVMAVLALIQSFTPENIYSLGLLVHPAHGAGLERDEFDVQYSYMTKI
jgi:hypothetical protein